MVLLRNTCLNRSFQRQLGRLVTVSDPLTTSSLYRQSNSLHKDGELLLYQAQLFGTASLNTSETQHYPLIRLGAILKLTFLLVTNTRPTQPFILTGSINRVPTCPVGVKAGRSPLSGGR